MILNKKIEYLPIENHRSITFQQVSINCLSDNLSNQTAVKRITFVYFIFINQQIADYKNLIDNSWFCRIRLVKECLFPVNFEKSNLLIEESYSLSTLCLLTIIKNP
jgi:hypothetical protein